MSERHDFDVNGFTIKVTVGGHIDDELLDEQAVNELRDVVNFAAAWTQKHHRGLRIPRIPAVPHYEQPPPIPGEIWRTIPGFEHTHEASNQYRIRSMDRVVPMAHPSKTYAEKIQGFPKIEKLVHGRILKTRMKGFIAYVTLCCPDGRQRAFQVRKLVESAFPELVHADALV
jgi:hypothetical protein